MHSIIKYKVPTDINTNKHSKIRFKALLITFIDYFYPSAKTAALLANKASKTSCACAIDSL